MKTGHKTRGACVPKILLPSLVFVFSALPAFATDKYWVGSGNYDDTDRWALSSGGTDYTTTPGSSDLAIFDGGGTSNCTINSDADLLGIDIRAAYTGTITLKDAITLEVGDNGFVQAGGTFASQTGGSNELRVAGSWSNTGGVFTHSGTVTLDGTASGKTLLSGGQAFHNLTLNRFGGEWTLNDRLHVDDTLTITNGTLDVSTNDYAIRTNSWFQTGGTFTPRKGTVFFNVGDGIVASTSAFYNLQIGGASEDGLVGYWKMDETSGTTAADSSGSGNDGIHNNSPTISSDTPSAIKFTNPRCLSLNGTDQGVDVDSFSWSADGDPISVSFWVHSPGADTDVAFGVGESDNLDHRILSHAPWSDNTVIWDYGDESVNGRVTTSFAGYEKKWTHVALVSEGLGGNFQAIYLDGILANSNTVSDAPDIVRNDLYIGCARRRAGARGNFQAGRMDARGSARQFPSRKNGRLPHLRPRPLRSRSHQSCQRLPLRRHRRRRLHHHLRR